MLRSAHNLRCVCVGLVVAAIGALVMPSPWASAQASARPSVQMTATAPSPDGSPGVVAIGVDPGTSTLSVLSADLTYDPTQVEVISCEIAEAGACNDVGGTVKFSVFRVSRLPANDQLATISFRPVAATGQAGFTLDVTVAADARGVDVGAIAIQPIAVGLSEVVDGPDVPEVPGETPTEPTVLPIDVEAPPPVYGASITGTVRAMTDGRPLEAIQVCATQPLAWGPSNQSCGSTNSQGQFVLDGVTTGNYWINTIDPLALFQDGRPVLVGVGGDQVAEGGVTVWLVER